MNWGWAKTGRSGLVIILITKAVKRDEVEKQVYIAKGNDARMNLLQEPEL